MIIKIKQLDLFHSQEDLVMMRAYKARVDANLPESMKRNARLKLQQLRDQIK